MGTFRKLLASEIDCRVATVKQPDKDGNGGGVSILLYKDARVDMRLLDEVYGAMGWKREHQVLDGRLYCTISVYDSKNNQWISKQDVGVESYTEKEKGQASDSFKRAGFNWGIGRELYTAPFIWLNLSKNEWRKSVQGGLQPNINVTVSDIQYDGDDICSLVLVDRNGAERYRWAKPQVKPATIQQVKPVTLQQAIEEMKKCKNVNEVTACWQKYPQFKTEQEFIDVCTDMGNSFK
jgi:hypothetical protein